MKIIVTFLFLLLIQDSFAQKAVVAFVNIDTIVNSCMKNSGEEIRMMETILEKRKSERDAEKDENKRAVFDQDIIEYETRISQRKEAIKAEMTAWEPNCRAGAEKTAAEVTKKKKYKSYVDISKDKPLNYDEKDDLTEMIKLKMNGQ